MTRLLAVAVVVSTSLPALAAEEQLKIAVYDFKQNGVSAAVADAANAQVAAQLQKLGLFRVVTKSMISSLLAAERQKQLLGCSDDTGSCMAEIADALGVDFMVIGTLTRLDGRYSLDLGVLDAKRARRVSQEIADAATESQLAELAGKLTPKLVAPILKEHSGQVKIDASERGAEVRIDGISYGSTPLEGMISVPAGPHELEIVKESFVTYRDRLNISRNQISTVSATMRPSPDYIRAYESKSSKIRYGAYATTALAVAGLGTSLAMQLLANAEHPGFLEKRRVLESGDESARNDANAIKTSIQQKVLISQISLGVGAAAAVTAAILWLVGDSPGRYAQFKEVAPVALVPLAEGGLLVGSGFAF